MHVQIGLGNSSTLLIAAFLSCSVLSSIELCVCLCVLRCSLHILCMYVVYTPQRYVQMCMIHNITLTFLSRCFYILYVLSLTLFVSPLSLLLLLSLVQFVSYFLALLLLPFAKRVLALKISVFILRLCIYLRLFQLCFFFFCYFTLSCTLYFYLRCMCARVM